MAPTTSVVATPSRESAPKVIVIVVVTTRVMDVHIHIVMDIDVGVPVDVDVGVPVDVDIAVAGADASSAASPGRRGRESDSEHSGEQELQLVSCGCCLVFHILLSFEDSNGLPARYSVSVAGRISILADPLGGVNTKVLSGRPLLSLQSEKMAVNCGAVASCL
jgi:hypothetical protein